jgi:DNA-binding transcriptional LysR family regulator
MIDNLTDLRVFTRIVATGSLSQAGRELNLSLAAVSKRLAALEDRLGVRLINRTTRRLAVTQEGGEFFARCQRILADLEEAEAAVTTGRESPKGLLRVTAAVAFGRRRVAPVIVGFAERHPDIQVDLELTDRMVDLVDSGIDVAIRTGALTDSSLIARKLVDNHRVVVASPAYLARRGAPRTPADLTQHQCLNFSALGDIWPFVGPDGPFQIKIDARLRTNDGEVGHEWALEGAGLVMKSIWDVCDDLAAGRLVRVLPEWRSPTAAIHAIYPTSRHLSSKVRSFVDYLGEHLRAMEPLLIAR